MEKLTQKQIQRLKSYIKFLDAYSELYFDGNTNEAIISAMREWVRSGEWLPQNDARLNGIERKYQQFLRHKRDGILTSSLVNEIKQYSK
jgi:hypothetical protein